LPAIERYTGAWYGVINKLKRENKFPSNIDIVIISAKYGFLRSVDMVEYYDLKMKKRMARELNNNIIKEFKRLFEHEHYESIFINLGKDYLLAIEGLRNLVPKNTNLIFAKGTLGVRKREMRKWILSIIDS
jgi:hypothetical protein